MTTFKVTVKKKTLDHPFFGQGSEFGYVIDGVEGAILNLKRGRKYTFSIDSIGHPFYLTTDDTGGHGFPGSLMKRGGFDAGPTDQGVMIYKVPQDFPDSAFYQCGVHPKMGGFIFTEDESLNIDHGKYPSSHLSNQNNQLTIQISEKWTGLTSPTNLAFAQGDGDHYYIADQIGIIYRVTKSTNSIDVFLDVRSYIPQLNSAYDERGLLGMAFHPDFIKEGSNKGRFFIFYSSIIERSGKRSPNANDNSYYNCLSEFRLFHGHVLMENEIVLLRILKDLPIHNGGKVATRTEFNRSLLYLTVGDGGPQKDPENKGQRLDTWEGKILRIDVTEPGKYYGSPSDTEQGLERNYYQIPNDNPFINVKGSKPEIFAYGFRNPWGLCFSEVGIISTDAGFNEREEIDLVVSGGNYGWNIKEGTMITPWRSGEPTGDMIDPVYEYRTHHFPELDFYPELSVIVGGHWIPNVGYVFGDYSGVIMVAHPTNQENKWIRTLMAKYPKKILSFGKDGSGKLYILATEFDGPQGKTGVVSQIEII